jgi:hypothetical protein
MTFMGGVIFGERSIKCGVNPAHDCLLDALIFATSGCGVSDGR